MLLRRICLLATLCSSLPAFAVKPPVPPSVRIDGQVGTAGDYVAPNGRLSSAMIAASPTSDAFLPGTSFNRVSARQDQLRLKAGLEYSLAQLTKQDDVQTRHIAERLLQWLRAREATGRVRILTDARLMQAQPRHDPVILGGDQLHIPLRPTSIQVMGAVDAAGSSCTLPHVPLKSAPQYLADCPGAKGADPDNVYVIQPDGLVQKLGIATWNRADPHAIAPGGALYVPIAESRLQSLDPDFNSEFAAFVATQPVSL